MYPDLIQHPNILCPHWSVEEPARTQTPRGAPRPTYVVDNCRIGPGLQQQLHHLPMIQGSSHVERRVSRLQGTKQKAAV